MQHTNFFNWTHLMNMLLWS